MQRVLIADNVHADCDTILRGYGLDVVRALGKSNEELAQLVPEFDAMIVRSAVKVGRPLIEKMERMKVIGRAGAGVDNIDVEAATERGILVMNTPGGNTISAAEHTVAMILALCRRIPAANRSLLAEQWDRKTFVGTELLGKTIGILGIGRIGSEVAKRLRPFEVRLIGYDPLLSDEAVRELGIEPVDLLQALERSDVLTLHLPLNDETRGMIGADALAAMKPNALLVNCARGGVIDEAALLAALESGRIAGAAFDVFSQEPPEFPNDLIRHPRFLATPHIAASTEEAQERVALAIAHQIGALLEGKQGVGLVNADGLEGALREEFSPYALAARTLGSVVGRLFPRSGLACRLHVCGDDAALMLNGLGASFLAGLFDEGEGTERINAVNAGLMAAKKGVTLELSGEGAHDIYRFLLLAEIGEGSEVHRVGMTLFGRGEPRLVMLDDIHFDIAPHGPMLVIEHRDTSGILAGIFAILGEGGGHIADLSLGRHADSDTALTLLRTDSPIEIPLLESISAIEGVNRVRTIFYERGSFPLSSN